MSQTSKVNGQWSMVNGQMSRKGQSIVEVIIAVFIFTMIAASSVVTIIGSFSSTRLAKEETVATFLATEGLEAAESVRNQDWANLLDGTYGVGVSASAPYYWQFVAIPDATGKFDRTITVSSVQRDADGNIVESGGTDDPDTKKITSNVTWNFTSVRVNGVEVQSYLTNWQTSEGPNTGGEPLPTGTPIPSVTPVVYASCGEYCIANGYSVGTCARNAGACSSQGYDYLGGGDVYCTGGPSADTCCCIP